MILLLNQPYKKQSKYYSYDSFYSKVCKLDKYNGFSSRRTISSLILPCSSFKNRLIVPTPTGTMHKRYTGKPTGHVHKVVAAVANANKNTPAAAVAKASQMSNSNATFQAAKNPRGPNQPETAKAPSEPATKSTFPKAPETLVSRQTTPEVMGYVKNEQDKKTTVIPQVVVNIESKPTTAPSSESKTSHINTGIGIGAGAALQSHLKQKMDVSETQQKEVAADMFKTATADTTGTPNDIPHMESVTKTPELPEQTTMPALPSSMVPSEISTTLSPIISTPPSSEISVIQVFTPPPAPPMPSQDLCPHLQKHTGQLNDVAVINEINKKKIQNEPEEGVIRESGYKPTEIPEQYKVKNINGVEFTTKIKADTTADQISLDEWKHELKMRGFLKSDQDITATTIQLDDGSYATIGTSKHKLKLTPLGQAYATLTQNEEETVLVNFPIQKGIVDRLIIIAPPQGNENLVIEMGIHKHLVALYNAINDQYYGVGYLTSKTSGTLISPQQIKTFQQIQKGEDITGTPKSQYFFSFKNPIIMDPADIQRVYGDTEYIKTFTQDVRKDFDTLWKTMSKQPTVKFNRDGISKTQGIKMCQAHDAVVANKEKHPQTPDQNKQQEKGKAKQQEKQKEKQAKQYEIQQEKNETKNL